MAREGLLEHPGFAADYATLRKFAPKKVCADLSKQINAVAAQPKAHGKPLKRGALQGYRSCHFWSADYRLIWDPDEPATLLGVGLRNATTSAPTVYEVVTLRVTKGLD